MLPMSFECEMDAVPYDDRELYYAIQKSQESNSVLPVIKVELKRKIQFRRFSNGEEEIKPRWNKQEIRTLRPDEIDRKNRILESNRRSAAKCRRKVKDKREENSKGDCPLKIKWVQGPITRIPLTRPDTTITICSNAKKLASLHKCNTELREHLQKIERETTYIRQCLENCIGRPTVERILKDLWSSQISDRTVNPNVHG